MKRIARLSLFVLAASTVCVQLSASDAHAAGGPDAWGYTWRAAGEPGAAPFEWIDISTIGTPVAAFPENTTSTAIDLGMDFPWYWSTHREVYIGATGWVGFNPDTHLAPCAPAIPSAGGFNDFLAPYLTDLTLAGEGNPGQILTWRDEATNRFVISWLDVPFRNPDLAAGYEGNNSFQVILYPDGRIRFQYLDVNSDLIPARDDCGTDILVGIENITGNIGLEIASDVFDPGLRAIEFSPPTDPGFAIADPGPEWIFSPGSGGRIVEAGVPFDVETGVRNFGNTAIGLHAAQVSIRQGVTVADSRSFDSPGMAALVSATLPTFNATLSEPGAYTVTATTVSPDDINPSNNQRLADLQVVSFDDGPVRLTWAGTTESDANTSAFVGGSVLTHFESPRAPIRVLAVDGVIRLSGDISTANIFVSIIDDDGPSGAPGTVLARQNALASYTFIDGGWARVPLTVPQIIDDGTFYVAYETNTPNLTIGVDQTPPFSLQTWENLTGVGVYRGRYGGDFMLGALVEPAPVDPGGDDTGLSDAGGSDAGSSDAGVSDASGDTNDDTTPSDDVTIDSETTDSSSVDDVADPDTTADIVDPVPDSSTPDAQSQTDGQGGGDTSVLDTTTANDGQADSEPADAFADTATEGSNGDNGDSGGGGGGCAATGEQGSSRALLPGLFSLLLLRRKRVAAGAQA